jgi:starch-binding outer membrane protein, SusD/RagB family
MKFIFKTMICCSAATTILAGCSKLNEDVYSSVFTTNFYRSAQDAEAALTAAYGPISDLYFGPAAVLTSDFSADQTYPRAVVGRNTLTLFSYDVDYTTQKSFGRTYEGPQGIWQFCYKGIENANWVIEKVPAISMDETRKNAIVGEALFLRAFYHFTLTKNFRDIVIRTTPSKQESDALQPKSSQAEVFTQIYNDLTEAAAKLPSYSPSSARGRASKEVAIGLHAKAALYGENWQLAKEKAVEVINSGRYTLLTDVLDLYNVDKEDFARSENMFAFEGEIGEVQDFNYMMGLAGPRNSQGRDYGNSTFGSFFAYQAFFDSFDPADHRRKLLDTTYINRSNQVVPQRDITPITPNGVLVKKYMDKNSTGDRNRTNIPILRLADMYLIAAEAEARLNGGSSTAYQYINAIRNRAGLPDLEADLAREEFISAVLQERSWEFFAEGDRWYDLTRTNTFLNVIPQAVNDVYPTRTPLPKNRYFPIPLDEIRANPNIQQNPEWE